MLEKKIVYRYTVLPDGQIQTRKATQIWEDDVMLSESYHREVMVPGQDVSKHPDEMLKRIVNGNLWDADTVAKYNQAKNKE